MASQEKEISIRAYAVLLKVDEKTVRKARNAGLLRDGYNSATRKIIPSLADKAWGFTQKVIKPKAGVSRAKAIKKLSSGMQPSDKEAGGVKFPDKKFEDMDADELQACLPVSSAMPLEITLRYREIIALALDKIKLRKEIGALLDKDKVNAALFTLGRAMRDRLLLIPKRIAADVMAAPNEVEVANIIEDELKQVLHYFADMKVEKDKI